MLSSSFSSSTESLLNLFPMFGHPGISALEYAGQVDAMRKQSTSVSEVPLKRKSSTTMLDDAMISTTTTRTELKGGDVTPPLHFVDEYGHQQRRRGTFINHTPRTFEIQQSKCVEVYRPSRAESENYSRPLSRTDSMASTSLAVASPTMLHPSPEIDSSLSSTMDLLLTNPHRRSFSAPPSSVLTCEPGIATSIGQPSRESSFRSTRRMTTQGQETKRQRRQTPFKLSNSQNISVPANTPSIPWITKHRCNGMDDFIGDVPFDMDREVSADLGTYGIIQKYFDSQGDSTLSPNSNVGALSSSPTIPPSALPEPSLGKPFKEPVAIYPIDEMDMADEAPPLPYRSPKRLTNSESPSRHISTESEDNDITFAAEGQYSAYDEDDDTTHNFRKKDRERPHNIGRLAPAILGHDALTASSELGLNDLSYFLKHTGPSSETLSPTTQEKKKSLRLFKVKQRKSLAARVGSVEGSPQRMRRQPPIPACAKEMMTSAGARHLRIIIPTETSPGSQAAANSISKQRSQRRSRHIPISFTEEMLNPLASSQLERIIASYETPEPSATEQVSRSPRSNPKKSPKTSTPVPAHSHPLAMRDEQTRARKLRDLQRIKRKPVPIHTQPEQQYHSGSNAGALLTPAHTPEPVASSNHEDEGIEEESPSEKVHRLQDIVESLQRQNKQLAETLAKIVGLDLEGEELKSEEVLKRVSRQLGDSRSPSV